MTVEREVVSFDLKTQGSLVARNVLHIKDMCVRLNELTSELLICDVLRLKNIDRSHNGCSTFDSGDLAAYLVTYNRMDCVSMFPGLHSNHWASLQRLPRAVRQNLSVCKDSYSCHVPTLNINQQFQSPQIK